MKSILPNLSQYKIVLGSNSPRRRELLAGLDIEFEVQTIPGIDESFPKTLRPDEVPVYIARKKAEAYIPSMSADELLITADTIVWTFGEILGKPKDREDAISMLRKLSGRVHEVITGVCITTTEWQRSFAAQTEVRFSKLSEEEITYYIDKFQPMDKAGAYGIQGKCAIYIEGIEGDYNNVVGLPGARIYKELQKLGIDPYLW